MIGGILKISMPRDSQKARNFDTFAVPATPPCSQMFALSGPVPRKPRQSVTIARMASEPTRVHAGQSSCCGAHFAKRCLHILWWCRRKTARFKVPVASDQRCWTGNRVFAAPKGYCRGPCGSVEMTGSGTSRISEAATPNYMLLTSVCFMGTGEHPGG